MRLIPRNDPEANALAYKSMEQPLRKVLHSYTQRNTKGMMDRITGILTSAGYEGGNAAKVLVKKADPSTIRTLEELALRLPDGARQRMMGKMYGQIGSGSLTVRKAVQNVLNYGMAVDADKLHKEAKDVLRQTALEGMYRGEFMVQKAVGIGWQMETPNVKQVDAFLKDKWSLRDATAYMKPMSQVMKDQVTESIFLGESPQKMAKRMERVEEINQVRAKRNARTITTAVANEAQMESYKKDGIKKYRWVATFDERTCPACGALDGQEFEMGKGQYPPVHPNCRCTTAAVLDKAAQARVNAIVEAHKGDKGAKYVPPGMTYQQWADKNIVPPTPKAPKAEKPTKKQERVEEIKSRGVYVPPHDVYGQLSESEISDMDTEEKRTKLIEMRHKILDNAPGAELTTAYPASYSVEDREGSMIALELRPEANEWEKRLTEEERRAVVRYTGTAYDPINQFCYLPEDKLWFNPDTLKGLSSANTDKLLTKDVATMEHLDSAISKFEVRSPMVVHRGMSNPFDVPIEEMAGKVWVSDGYTSSSVSAKVARNFGPVQMHIMVPKGKGIGAYVERISEFDFEREFIFKRGSKFKIEQVDGSDVYVRLIE